MSPKDDMWQCSIQKAEDSSLGPCRHVHAYVPTATPWKTLPMIIIEMCSAAAKMIAAIMNKIPLYLYDSKRTLCSTLCITYKV